MVGETIDHYLFIHLLIDYYSKGIPFSGTGSNITPPDVGAYFYNTTEIVDSFHRFVKRHLNVCLRYLRSGADAFTDAESLSMSTSTQASL